MKKIVIKLLKILGLKGIAKKCYAVLQLFYFNYFTITGIKQNYNYKNIPIIIISFNQLFYLEQLILFLQNKGYTNIIIIDNNSTYPPLLKYFNSISKQVKVYRLNQNHGHLVFWRNKNLFKKYTKGYYIVTDADIVPDQNCPDDFVKYFKKRLNQHPKFVKVGFSLKIDNIPEHNQHKNKILNWEKKFWQFKMPSGDFKADIDTTFALYKPGFVNYQSQEFYHAIRAKIPYIADHGGWCVDYNNPTIEQLYYFKTASQSASWLSDEKGNLVNKLYE